MIKQSLYIQKLNEYINTFTKCYYEQAPVSGSFPYCVLLPPTPIDLSYGDSATFDIEVYANELTGTEEVEDLCDLLRNKLDNYILNSENNFTSCISFDSYYNLRETEQDILARKLTFSTRIFYM